MPAGRPLKFKTVEELQEKIDKYFIDTNIKQWTITGLALALGTYRQTLINYEEKDEFLDAIKTAKQKVEYSYELDLKEKGNTGTIFALKNFDWKDKTELDNNIGNKDDKPFKCDFSNLSTEQIKELLKQEADNK